MKRYASNTDVSAEKSQAELKRLLTRYGADGFILGEIRQRACVQFAINGRVIKFSLEMPDRFVRATLEAVEEGVVDFDEAMMPFTVVEGGQTFAERYGAEVSRWIEGGNAPKTLMLPGAP